MATYHLQLPQTSMYDFQTDGTVSGIYSSSNAICTASADSDNLGIKIRTFKINGDAVINYTDANTGANMIQVYVDSSKTVPLRFLNPPC